MSHVSVADHRAAVARVLGSPRTGVIALDWRAAGRRLAADLLAADDLPRFDTSAMDGYAVRPAGGGGRSFRVVGDLAAGDPAEVVLGPGQAVRIMTGARVPASATAVVPVERTDAAPTGPVPARVAVSQDPAPGQHVRRQGEDACAGAVLASAGSVVTPALLALARSAGCAFAEVFLRTRVAVVATGTELTAPGRPPGSAGIHESNSDMVAALARESGCDITRVRTCSDDAAEFASVLLELDAAPDVDLVVTTGGVSQGAYEVVKQVCGPLPTFAFDHVAMQPGAPQGLGRFGATPVVCLPGTPVGSFVSFVMLLRPSLDGLHGAPPRVARRAAYVGPGRRVRPGRVQFVTAVLTPEGSVTAAHRHHLTALAAANALIEVPEDVEQLVEGDVVTVHPL
ncbi:MAG TPA: gephyrin-like molybdotransferase Glp [Intrasporangium sp.]|uniref:molybdopterin molybdotransferase MoeA n=1 Tax=Intrasporangium sp. TaxID=1925024 RepID=UPI002D77D1DF|nr:gephyrin-like molybdotransferase Glp [Intrasporangium sp.]HET7399172.1 gephyrin-like molybdotransferase Glp [Intrasporangium sp.]